MPKQAKQQWALPDAPAVVLALAIILGLGLRLSVVTMYDFPLNDGGLFYTMVKDLLSNGLRTPLYTSYNSANIPFVYPPLGLYLAAILAKISVPILETFRFVPLLFSVASIPATYSLARKLLDDRLAAAFAALAIAILPESFSWRIMGGGITRSIGFLFGILALDSLWSLLAARSWKTILLTGLFAAATLLSHPEAAIHAALGALVLLAFRLRRREQFGAVLTAGGIAVLASAVWWLPALMQHGFTPWTGASGSRAWIPWYVLFFRMLKNVDPLTLVVALFGLITAGRQTSALLLLYGALMFMVLPRSAPQFALLVVAMFFGVGMRRVIDAILKPMDMTRSPATPPWRRPSRLALAVVLLFNFVPNWGAAVGLPILHALTPPEREAMSWAGQTTPVGSTFLVVEGTEFYAARNAEWFPALSNRLSAVAVQGYEWLTEVDIARQITTFNDLQVCGYTGKTCLDAWLGQHDVRFDYVYVLKQNQTEETTMLCCQRLIDTLDESGAYTRTFDNADVVIFKRGE